MKKNFVLMLFLFSCAHKDPKFDPKSLATHVKVLSSDEFEGRAPNSAGEEKTIEYIVSEFTKAGLSPGGEWENGKRLWTQKVPLIETSFEGPVNSSLFIKGNKKLKLEQGNDIAIRATADMNIKNAPIVFVGFGVKASELNWDDFKGIDLRGKIALVLINDPDFGTENPGKFGGKAMTYYGRWTYKFEQMKRLGALGTMIIHEKAPASYGWDTVKNSNTNKMFSVISTTNFESWIQLELAKKMFQASNLDFENMKKLAQSEEFTPMELKGVKFNTSFKVKNDTVLSYNVLGIKSGIQRPQEVIAFSGHWDHLGVDEKSKAKDRIFNGAIDNATGISSIIELAKKFGQRNDLDRSILFLAVTAEERGLLGSQYYVENPVYPLSKTVSVINLDALSPGEISENFKTTGNIKQDLQDLLIEKAKKFGVNFTPDSKLENGYFYRSDHFSFAKAGVPAISFSSGTSKYMNSEEYTEKRYHQVGDEYDPAWSFTGMARDLEIIFEVVLDLSKSTYWPNWGVGTEFRAIRDKS